MRRLLKLRTIFLAAIGLIASGPAYADTNFEAYPTAWRLEGYGGNVAAFYTISTCSVGAIRMSSTASEDEKNRFWSLVMTAKINGTKVGIYYETTSGSCNITSFYAQ